jgi:hypothetical protein
LNLRIHRSHILVDDSLQVVLLTVDLHENFIDVERVAEASMLSFQAAGVNGTELYAPEANCRSGIV